MKILPTISSLLCVACSNTPSKDPPTDTTGSTEDSGSDSGNDGGGDPGDSGGSDGGTPSEPDLATLVCETSCGNLRVLLRATTGSVSLSLPIDMFAANTAGVADSWEGTAESGEAFGTWSEEEDPGICSSIEEWPQAEAYTTTFATYAVNYVPLHAWDPSEPEWSWDGTELGELSLNITDLRLVSAETTVSGPVDIACTLPFSKPDLPAR